MDGAPNPQDISLQAKAHYHSRKYSEALSLYKKALDSDQVQLEPLSEAEIKNDMSVILLKLQKPHEALNLVRNTDKIFAEAGDRHRQAIALGNQGSAYEALGNLKEAIRYYQRSADILKNLGDTDTRSYVLQNLSSLQIRTGQYFDALATMKVALENKKTLSQKEKLLYWLVTIPFQRVNR